MCNCDNPQLDAAFDEMDKAMDFLYETQEKTNQPLLNLLFKLIDLKPNDNISCTQAKVVHTYTHKFMDFYLTECPNTRVWDAELVDCATTKLNTMGVGLVRLLKYLKLEDEANELIELVDNLEFACQNFIDAMNTLDRVEQCCDDCDCDCDCNCDCDCDCGCDCDDHDCGCKCDEDCCNCCNKDECDECDTADEGTTTENDDVIKKVTKQLFDAVCGKESTTSSKQSDADKPKVSDDEIAKHILAKLLGVSPKDIKINKKTVKVSPNECDKYLSSLFDIDPQVEYLQRMYRLCGLL